MTGRIIIAEDTATYRLSLRTRLQTARYNCESVETSDELLQKFLHEGAELVLFSDALSDRPALDICKHLRRLGAASQVPFLLLSERYAPEDRQQALEAGFDDILARPYSEQGLLSRIRALLRSGEISSELKRRQKTAAGFGFAEAPSEFTARPNVAMITDLDNHAERWTRQSWKALGGPPRFLSHAAALDDAAGSNPADVYIVDAAVDHQNRALTLLPDLRSRSGGRHSVLIYIHPTEDPNCGGEALDLGANDTLPTSANVDELALRIQKSLKLKQTSEKLRHAEQDGLRLAVTDPLTGLYNRRFAESYLDQAAREYQDTGQKFVIMLADLDHFKKVNDEYGHRIGDLVLKNVAQTLRNSLRGKDLVTRFGGEEFLIVMPATDVNRAKYAAERLCRLVADRPIQLEQTQEIVNVTISIGVAIGRVRDGKIDLSALMDTADLALYDAKAEGRNQVRIQQCAA